MLSSKHHMVWMVYQYFTDGRHRIKWALVISYRDPAAAAFDSSSHYILKTTMPAILGIVASE